MSDSEADRDAEENDEDVEKRGCCSCFATCCLYGDAGLADDDEVESCTGCGGWCECLETPGQCFMCFLNYSIFLPCVCCYPMGGPDQGKGCFYAYEKFMQEGDDAHHPTGLRPRPHGVWKPQCTSCRLNTLETLHARPIHFILAALLLCDVILVISGLELKLWAEQNITTAYESCYEKIDHGEALPKHYENLVDQVVNATPKASPVITCYPHDDPGGHYHNAETLEHTEHVLGWVSVAILSIFFVENVLTMIAAGPCQFFCGCCIQYICACCKNSEEFMTAESCCHCESCGVYKADPYGDEDCRDKCFKSFFWTLDFTMVCSAIAFEMAFLLGDHYDPYEFASLIIIARIWRFFRVTHAGFWFEHSHGAEMHHADTKFGLDRVIDKRTGERVVRMSSEAGHEIEMPRESHHM